MLFGDSDAMRTIHRTIHQLRNNDITSVLITGETGVGKEVVAQAIHAGGPRASAPFVAPNCGAIPYELAESVFFGHVRGSFTGAVANQTGYFERADGGTLFLDEIGDMSIETQVKLLRALAESIITPIGATESKKVDIRIIAATNADLKAKVEMGQFRQDLYFRLAVMSIEISPLRERKDDILPLAEYMLSVLATRLEVPIPELTPKAVEVLEGYTFPGNVRELRNIIEGALSGAIVGEDSSSGSFALAARTAKRLESHEREGWLGPSTAGLDPGNYKIWSETEITIENSLAQDTTRSISRLSDWLPLD